MNICYVTTIGLSIKAFFIPQLKYLASKGHNVSVICSYEDGLQELLGDTITYIPVEIPRGMSAIGTLKATKNIAQLLKKGDYDIVQYSTPNAAFCTSIASCLAGVKVRNYHLMGFRYQGFNGIKRAFFKKIEQITCRLSTDIECVSLTNREMGIKEKVFQGSKAVVVWNGSSGGVDCNRFSDEHRDEWKAEIRKKLNISDSFFVFGFAGRITKDKGIDELLAAFQQIKNQNTVLLMIGDFEGEQDLNQDLLHKAKLDPHVVFVPFVDNIEQYYAAMDVIVLPSYREGFGMVIAEAAAMGVPAIVTRIPGPTDFVLEGKTALVVPPRDSTELAKAMNTFIEDPSLAEQMGKMSSSYTKDMFDSQILCRKILERKEMLVTR